MFAADVGPRSSTAMPSCPLMRELNSTRPLERRAMRSAAAAGAGESMLAGTPRNNLKKLATELTARSHQDNVPVLNRLGSRLQPMAEVIIRLEFLFHHRRCIVNAGAHSRRARCGAGITARR